jgi:hypothetical protein
LGAHRLCTTPLTLAILVATTWQPAACTAIGNSNNYAVTCTNATDTQANSQDFACFPGYYLVDNAAPTADTCVKCPGIPNSNNLTITCGAGGSDPKGDYWNGNFLCNPGTKSVFLNGGFVISCDPCPTIANSNNVGLSCGSEGVCFVCCSGSATDSCQVESRKARDRRKFSRLRVL